MDTGNSTQEVGDTQKQQHVVRGMAGKVELAYRNSLKSASTFAAVAVILQTLTIHGFQMLKVHGLQVSV